MCHNMYSTSPQSWVNCFAECGLASARWAIGGGSAFPLTYHSPGQGIPTQPSGYFHNRHSSGALVLLLLVSCMVIPVATHGQLTFAQRGFPLYWQILLSQIVGPGCCLVSLHSPSHSSWFACFNAQLSAPPTALARYHHVVRSLDPLFHLADEPPNPFLETRCSTSSPVLVGETSRICILLVGWLSSCTGNVEFFAQSRTFVLAVQAFSMQASPLFEVTTEYSDR